MICAPIASQVGCADCHPNLYRFLVSRGYQRNSQRRSADRGDFAAELAAAGTRYFPGFAEDPDAVEATLVAVIGTSRRVRAAVAEPTDRNP